ncbi:MAG: peptide deformylase [SAR86 cluster bacterium]|nr:peptide deformylase [SAR86 cluster bacterium]|tara:strand:- start:562 stop:1062 length:501 start_codon:yes stop_codon:yes gene_type:complete
MALLKILVFPDPRLRTLAEPVVNFDHSLKKLTEDMLETMYQGSGIGLAATQVNIHKRIVVVDVSEGKNSPLILVNPILKKIVNPEKKSFSEGCLSVPGFYEELIRPSSVEINASDVNGEEVNIVAEGLLSVVIQHEMDHLDGKMMVDFISNVKREMIRKKLLKTKA